MKNERGALLCFTDDGGADRLFALYDEGNLLRMECENLQIPLYFNDEAVLMIQQRLETHLATKACESFNVVAVHVDEEGKAERQHVMGFETRRGAEHCLDETQKQYPHTILFIEKTTREVEEIGNRQPVVAGAEIEEDSWRILFEEQIWGPSEVKDLPLNFFGNSATLSFRRKVDPAKLASMSSQEVHEYTRIYKTKNWTWSKS